MIKNVSFNAEPLEEIKVGMDLAIPDNLMFKFSLSGDCDKKTLKKLIRLVKYNSKTDEQAGNKKQQNT